MKLSVIRSAVIGAVLLAGSPASAAVIADAFTSFNGTQGGGGFLYGQGPAGSGQVGLFGSTPNCFIAGSICLQAAPNFDVPGVTKSFVPSFQYGTVNVPTDRLLLHPDASGQDLYAVYGFQRTGSFLVRGRFNVQDTSPTGVAVGFFSDRGPEAIGVIDAASPSLTFTRRIDATPGTTVAFTFNNAGNYFNDSTGFNFTISDVPEPASWAMMIGGFGAVGGSLRRRRGAAAAIA